MSDTRMCPAGAGLWTRQSIDPDTMADDAVARSGRAMQDPAAAKQARQDDERLLRTPSYRALAADDRTLVRQLVRDLSLASYGQSQGARITRHALDHLLDGTVKFRVEGRGSGPEQILGRAAGYESGGTVEMSRDWLVQHMGDADNLVDFIAHEVTHAVNGDGGGADHDPVSWAEEEQRAGLVGHRAGYGTDPSAEEESVRFRMIIAGEAPYEAIGDAYEADGPVKAALDAESERIAAGQVDPHFGVEDCQ